MAFVVWDELEIGLPGIWIDVMGAKLVEPIDVFFSCQKDAAQMQGFDFVWMGDGIGQC